MQDITKFVGLDVSKNTIAVAVADVGREAPRYLGAITNTPEAVRKLIAKIGKATDIEACYEAGPTGYDLQRTLARLGVHCVVIAPSLTPTKPGDRVKTDKRDAIQLAKLHRSGDLTPVYIPTEEDEALRDLVRAREDATEDLLRARHHIGKFLLRHDIKKPEKLANWKTQHFAWLKNLKFTNRCLEMTFQEYMCAMEQIMQRIERLDREIHEQIIASPRAPLIQALQTLRGVKETTAVTLVSEIGDFKRFKNAKQFMGYTGLVPSESSSGETRHKGRTTKAGNAHVRRVLVEAAWSYRYKPAVKGDIQRRQKGQPQVVRDISWKAQDRLHRKYVRLVSKGKEKNKVVAATARELAGFVWAIALKMGQGI